MSLPTEKKAMSDPLTGLTFRDRWYRIIFFTDTNPGQRFDILLIYAILLSVLVVMLDSVQSIHARYGVQLLMLEWLFTVLFTIEYAMRIYVSPKRLQYCRSFFGIVDLLSVLPTYLSLFLLNSNYLLMIRLLRVLRVYRVFKLFAYMDEANLLMKVMWGARRKISVFFTFVLILATVFGSFMFLLEGSQNGFTSIPKSIYWTIVTITTVGYGDITPQTVGGQFISTLVMLTGYSIIAVPTGIFTAQLVYEIKKQAQARVCPECKTDGHHREARFCFRCGAALEK